MGTKQYQAKLGKGPRRSWGRNAQGWKVGSWGGKAGWQMIVTGDPLLWEHHSSTLHRPGEEGKVCKHSVPLKDQIFAWVLFSALIKLLPPTIQGNQRVLQHRKWISDFIRTSRFSLADTVFASLMKRLLSVRLCLLNLLFSCNIKKKN